MLVLSLILVAVYISMLAILGMQTLTKGHKVLFVAGVLFPVLWIVGALIAPAPGSLAAAQRQ
jgi:hypothetical protein